MKKLLIKLITPITRMSTNFYKVAFGVAFSMAWARAMYAIWNKPSYLTFIWFYLGIGSMLLKWVFFEIIDRLRVNVTVKSVKKELEEADIRVQQTTAVTYQEEAYQARQTIESHISLEESIKRLEDEVSFLTDMVGTAIQRSLESLQNKDITLARHTIRDDKKVDQKEFAIRKYCMEVIETGFSGGSNLYKIVAILGIITELERIGDYAEGIAGITLMIGNEPSMEVPANISRMADKGLAMLQGSIQSFIKSDIERAASICQMDDEIDAMYDDTFRELIFFMVQDSSAITKATRLIWAAHNLERFADRVTNICEWVPFSITGDMQDIGASKY
jgi:phosphate transport system protein